MMDDPQSRSQLWAKLRAHQELLTLQEADLVNSNTSTNDPTMTDDEPKTLRDVCFESFKDGPGEEISRLSVTVEQVLNSFGCRSPIDENNVSSTSKLNHLPGVRPFLIFNHILEVSIMMVREKRNDSKTHCYYVSFNFPEEVHLYEVARIEIGSIPKFLTQTRDKIIDSIKISNIVCVLGTVVDKFCFEFIKKEQFPRREFSMRAIEPLFSFPKTPTKKRKREENDEKEFLMEGNPIYDRLFKLYDTMAEKPCESARLFAIIHDLLVTNHACRISVENSQWPGGANYDAHICDLSFPESSVDNLQDDLVDWHVFELCLLSNQKEFYLLMRYSDDVSKKCIKKIVKTLVPSFDPADSTRDRERVTNLNLWLSTIVDFFIRKVIDGSYRSITASSVSGSEDSDNEMS